MEERLALEHYSHNNPFVLTPYRPNFVLPASYRDKASSYVRYFNGYGESLTDYSQSLQSLGLGVKISDWY